jgi:hypothetical protein
MSEFRSCRRRLTEERVIDGDELAHLPKRKARREALSR